MHFFLHFLVDLYIRVIDYGVLSPRVVLLIISLIDLFCVVHIHVSLCLYIFIYSLHMLRALVDMLRHDISISFFLFVFLFIRPNY